MDLKQLREDLDRLAAVDFRAIFDIGLIEEAATKYLNLGPAAKEAEALEDYNRMIDAGFSDYEARADAWPEEGVKRG